MKQMSTDELRRFALANGAELVIEGKRFNSGRQQMDAPLATKPAAAPPAPAAASANPAPAGQESFSRAEVEMLLAEQEGRLLAHLSQILAPMAAPADNMVATSVVPHYLPTGEISNVDIKWGTIQ